MESAVAAPTTLKIETKLITLKVTSSEAPKVSGAAKVKTRTVTDK